MARIEFMAQSNVEGTCALCLKHRKLCKSHYLGRVLHTLSSDPDNHPVVMTPKLIKATPRQLWAHLLCEDCEALLNERGEKPVQALFNGASTFTLLNRMNVALAAHSEKSYESYSGSAMGIETEPLAYYALSILWKGSVHKWTTLDGQESSIDIGKYQEPIRKYLHGEAGFPDGVYVNVSACTDVGSQGMTYAPSLLANTPFPMYSLLVRGIWFHIITTDTPPSGLDDLCCVRSARNLLFKADCSKPFLESARSFHETATVSPELKKG